MSSILYIIIAILVLSVLIILHELGHYLMGKWLGFGIVEYSIGMGPVLFRVKGKETDFTLRAFLIGGSCRFYEGEPEADDADENEKDGEQPEPPTPKFPPEMQFNAQKPWKRFLVIAAGPLMNILTALVLAFVILLGYGSSTAYGTDQYVVVTEVESGSAAETAGVEAGDILLAVNDTAFTDYESFVSLFGAVRENAVDLTVLRGATFSVDKQEQGDTTQYDISADGGETLTIHAENIRDRQTGNNRLGVSLNIIVKSRAETKYNVLTAAVESFPVCWNIIKSEYHALFELVTGKAGMENVSGVIGIVSVMSETMETASEYGVGEVIYVILYLGALLSVNFAIINLLPLPALDGGRILFLLIEIVRGKPIPPEKEGIVHLIGIVLLMLLMVVLMVSDLMKCFRG